MMALPKDRAQTRVWKRCGGCGQSVKTHRATKYCPDCRARRGQDIKLETIYHGDFD